MMTKKERLLCIYIVLLGVASLTSVLSYGITGAFWWVETTRSDGERALILGLLHLFTAVGGVVSAALLIADWLNTDADGV
jgi:hypothetical protein